MWYNVLKKGKRSFFKKYYLDFEFTPIRDYQECLSIGVVKVSKKGYVSDSFYRVIRPTVRFLLGYKGFDRKEMKKAIPFAQMCRELKQWLDTKSMVY